MFNLTTESVTLILRKSSVQPLRNKESFLKLHINPKTQEKKKHKNWQAYHVSSKER